MYIYKKKTSIIFEKQTNKKNQRGDLAFLVEIVFK